MKLLPSVLAVLSVILLGGISGFEYWRQNTLLENAESGFTRWSLSLTRTVEHSINFGADTMQIFEFRVRNGSSGLQRCNKFGYSSEGEYSVAEVMDYSELPNEETRGCVKRVLTESGLTILLLVTSDRVFLQAM